MSEGRQSSLVEGEREADVGKQPSAITSVDAGAGSLLQWRHVIIAAILVVMYQRSVWEMYRVWNMSDSLYSHGILVPFISLGVIWIKRKEILAAPRDVSAAGYAWLVMGMAMLILGDFLGFRFVGQFSLIPVLTGVSILFLGKTPTKRMWFPLAFLLFMVPIPPSLTTSITFEIKIIAAENAVRLARLLTLPMVREGSWIHFNGDKLLIGDVCGGLRSLISLMAVGALVTYFSKTSTWARVVLIVMTVPIAIIANIVRIFLLCVVGYFYGSDVAAGRVHDVSGIAIFVVAFALFFGLEAQLRRWAPLSVIEPVVSAPSPSRPRTWRRLVVAALLLGLTTGVHLKILAAQDEVRKQTAAEIVFDIPRQIGDFAQVGDDVEVSDTVKRALETSSILTRRYMSPQGLPVDLNIVYAGSTRRSLHFPEICIAGEGRHIVDEATVPVGISFTARRLIVSQGNSREAVLYWFKTGDALTGNFFLNAYYWARNQLTFSTPTSSMIRLTAPIPKGPRGEEIAFAILESFALKFTPILLERVP